MRQAGRRSSAVGLSLLALFISALTLVVLAPAATAATIDDVSPTVTPTDGHTVPIALATTGLNIMVPVIIGITTLVLGIGVVAWAFLRTGQAQQQHR